MSDNNSSTKKLKFKKLTVKSGIRAGGDSLISNTTVLTWSHSNSAASDGTINVPTKGCPPPTSKLSDISGPISGPISF